MTLTPKFTLRKATVNDLEKIMDIIVTATINMNKQGNFQWVLDEYPNVDNILADIEGGNSYVLLVDGEVAGTTALTFSEDPDYGYIEDGQWLTQGAKRYATVHRIAISDEFKGQGLSTIFFELLLDFAAEQKVPSMRIDTHETNAAMRHIMNKLNFTHVGTIFYGESPRLAFEKILIRDLVGCE